MRKIFKVLGSVILVCVLCFGVLVGYLMATEYKPSDVESLNINKKQGQVVKLNTEYSALDWNVGYFGMDKDVDFFMDGGKMVLPIDKEHVENNLKNITKIIKEQNVDVAFLQEVDENSKRTFNINQVKYMDDYFNDNSSIFAYNFKVKYIPYPYPTLGKMNSGIYTSTKFNVEEAKRYQMPIPFTFPERLANLKRGFSVSYSNIENSDKKLVLINAHLDAYDKDNKGKIAQTKMLVEFMNSEYAKGNYILLGADFNQELRDLTREEIERVPENLWRAELFDKSLLGKNFKLYYDSSRPSARLNNKPYEKNSKNTYEFLIDGYIASDNIEVLEVKTLEEDYNHSDHNPVKLRYRLK
ncbi:endonuclease/exonuclease/phosphatase family protein [Gemella cuniculi]|uniref:endonuclease/exonuclease/phosphatase family protein n=1 Tax=Gemella cuniculi TaxID=150240 RepID=UPI0003FBEB9C|nr:endonuclease/exonuclease/phosphatase family protein [Gemella cuniculi]